MDVCEPVPERSVGLGEVEATSGNFAHQAASCFKHTSDLGNPQFALARAVGDEPLSHDAFGGIQVGVGLVGCLGNIQSTRSPG